MPDYYLVTNSGKTFFGIPKAWNVIKNAELITEPVTKGIEEMVNEAIDHPLGTRPLRDRIKPESKIVIIVDDVARPTPKKEFLTILMTRLRKWGVSTEQVDILIATGTHRPMTTEEIEAVYGVDLTSAVRFTNHDCRSPELVSIGRVKAAGEVKINPLLIQADVRIGVGSLIPHPFNGFGGGAKIVFPGVANYEAIRNHHCALMFAEGAELAQTENNPFLQEMCQIGRLAKLDFVVNAIYNANEEVKAVIAGDFEKVHEVGARMTLSELAVRFDQCADVTITSAFPYSEGPQTLKPLGPATTVTREGGVVILYVRTIKGGGYAEPFLNAFDIAYAKAQGNPRLLVQNSCELGLPIVDGAPMDFNGALNITLIYLNKIKVILVSRDSSAKQARRIGFEYVNRLEDAIQMVSKDIPNAMVNILPVGGLVIPVLKQGKPSG